MTLTGCLWRAFLQRGVIFDVIVSALWVLCKEDWSEVEMWDVSTQSDQDGNLTIICLHQFWLLSCDLLFAVGSVWNRQWWRIHTCGKPLEQHLHVYNMTAYSCASSINLFWSPKKQKAHLDLSRTCIRYLWYCIVNR